MGAGDKDECDVMMCDNLGLILSRHQDWWQRKGLLIARVPRAPLSKLWLPLEDGTDATEDLYLSPEMIDLDRLAGPQLDQGVIEIDGDRIRTKAPYRRIPWVEAILGCPVRATILSGSLRAQRLVSGWDEWRKLCLRRHRGWFDALLSLTELLVARGGGRYAVVQTLMRGPTDIAEAILGVELMSVSLYEYHRELKIFLEQVTDAFLEILDEQMARITSIEGGYVNAFGVWAPGTTVRIQCRCVGVSLGGTIRELVSALRCAYLLRHGLFNHTPSLGVPTHCKSVAGERVSPGNPGLSGSGAKWPAYRGTSADLPTNTQAQAAHG